MTLDPDLIGTCTKSLLNPAVCCADGCDLPALLALLVDDGDALVEHTSCLWHRDEPRGGDVIGSKTLRVRPVWGGPTRRVRVCRHLGGDDPCVPSCLFVYGEMFG